MADHSDVLIVGGGVIGLTTAYFLAREGATVTLVDRGDLGKQASWAGAGIISPSSLAHASTPFEQLRAHSTRMYPALSQQLRDETGIDNGYLVCGGVELLDLGEEDTADEWRSEGIAVEELDWEGVHQREPALASVVGHAYYLPEMAQVRNPRHVAALAAACDRRGVRLLPNCHVSALVRQGDRIDAVETGQGRLSAGNYLIATGAWTDALLAPLGFHPGIHPVRGQIALLNTGKPGVRPVIMHGKRYLVPRPDGRVLVGSTEENAGFDARPTAAAIAELLEVAVDLVPDLAGTALERCWAGLRPGTPDGLPYLGLVPGCSNLFLSAGHFRSGIQRSPASGIVLMELILGRPTLVPLHDFRLDRPSAPPGQPAFRE